MKEDSGKTPEEMCFQNSGSPIPEGNYEPGRKWILDPASETVLMWNRIFLFFCLVGLFVDPFFFYVPSVVNDEKSNSSCMTSDMNLGIVITCFRTMADVFYVLHVFVKFRTAYVSPSSRVFGKGELVMDLNLVARKYLNSDFFIDVIAALPLPQIVIWSILPAIRSTHADHTNNALVLIVLLQYIPRMYLLFPLSSQIIKATGVVAKTAWAGAAYNLLLYMLASHSCSSYGQTLSTSMFIGETSFAILIAILGLVLFAHLIGNMQTYLQSLTVRLEEWRLQRWDTEEWMRHRQLPQDLRELDVEE